MSRPRLTLPPQLEAEIEARTRRGESAKTIHEATGKSLSIKTIERRQNEIRAGTTAKPIQPTEALDVPENIPEHTPVTQIDGWIKTVEAAIGRAEADGNLAALSSLVMRLASLAEARRKAQPLPKVDPNESPNMIALAKVTEERLFKLVHDLFDPLEPGIA